MGRNVLGGELAPCSFDPLTGFYRDGCCNVGADDVGVHGVCVVVDGRFLEFSSRVGNDLSTPRPEAAFEGLKPGDSWCLCASRFAEALEAGVAPRVKLECTHRAVLEWVSLSDLQAHAVKPGE